MHISDLNVAPASDMRAAHRKYRTEFEFQRGEYSHTPANIGDVLWQHQSTESVTPLTFLTFVLPMQLHLPPEH